jgi:hypothetical protein
LGNFGRKQLEFREIKIAETIAEIKVLGIFGGEEGV